MKIKLDENLGARGRTILQAAHHDVATVAEEGLLSAADEVVIARCHQERRCLVTLDLDFGNTLLFRPSQYSGIAVLRLPDRPSRADLVAVVDTLVSALEREKIEGKLWVVQRGRVRVFREETDY